MQGIEVNGLKNSDDYHYIFVKFITLKNGRRIYASSYGKKAFRIRVKKK